MTGQPNAAKRNNISHSNASVFYNNNNTSNNIGAI